MVNGQISGIVYFFLIFFLEFEFKTPLIFGIFEEVFQDYLLVLFNHSIFTFNESRKQT